VAGYSVTYSVVDNATKNIDAINRRIAAMRAPMERLSKQVSRFVDVSGLRTIAQGFEWIGRAASNVLRTLTSIVPVLGTLTGAATIGGMVKLVGTFAKWSQGLEQTADTIGVTTQQLQQFQDATRLAGGSADEMTSAMREFYKIQTEFVRGQASTEAVGWLNRLGINVRDANGHLRNLAEIMPEVLEKIAAIKNPADRAAASAALLGDGNMKLVETFRQSSKSFTQWMVDAARYVALTDEQKKSLGEFTEAQGRLGVGFDALGQQVSAVLVKNLTPLMTALSEFVEKHTPEITQAVDDISKEFQEWTKGIDWNEVKENLNAVLAILRTMLDVLEAIGRALSDTAFLFGLKNRKFTKEDVINNSPWYAALPDADKARVRQQLGITDADAPAAGPSFLEAPGTWLRNRLLNRGQPTANPSPPPGPMNLPEGNLQRGAAIRDRLATDLDIPPEAAAGIVGNLQAESGLGEQMQERNPTSGRGGFGWAQWTGPRRVAFEAYAKEHGLDPRSDEANYGFLRKELQSPEYQAMLQRMRQNKGQSATIFEREFERPAVSNAPTRERYARQYAAVPAAAPPATVASPTGGAVNGKVDVAITGKNLSPDTAVTAKGSGQVKVAPPRVEHQELASV